jgi:hypothetical protein
MVSEVTVHSLGYVALGPVVRQHIIAGNCSPHGDHKAKRERKRQGLNILFKGTPTDVLTSF